jgi:hypothetical protein
MHEERNIRQHCLPISGTKGFTAVQGGHLQHILMVLFLVLFLDWMPTLYIFSTIRMIMIELSI